jgi:hypothetical protein
VTLTLLSALGNVCDKDLITPGMMTVCTYTLPDKDPSTQLLVTVAGDFGAGAAYALGWIAAIYVDDSQPIIVPSIPDTEPGHQVGPGGISTYGVSFPLPGIPVTLTVSQPTDDVSVEVWDTKNNLLCSSDQPGTTDETCSFTVPNDNSTIVYVSGAKTIGGAGYTLLLSPQ